jgi:8-oxo-dGTP pyrophosphatase MutT (NUDIX family)
VQILVDSWQDGTARSLCGIRDRLSAQLRAPVSVNVHTVADADPSLGAHQLFMHKNRADLFVYQAKYTSVPLFGRNIFAEFADPPPVRVRREAIRTIASFSYYLRKFLFDASMAPHGRAEFVRLPLIGLEYLCAFHAYLSMGYRDGLDHLVRQSLLDQDEITFLEVCAQRKASSDYGDVDSSFALWGCRVLDAIHKRMVDAFRRQGVSDVRWDGTDCAIRWDLTLPQAAAMTILRAGDQILLLHRKANDYLYPSKWTIPGGYLEPEEAPLDAARREVREETGSLPAVRQLFTGEPLVSPRLAAFAFEARVPRHVPPELVEHSCYELVDVKDVLTMDLTHEARLILERYVTDRDAQ